MMSSSNSKLSIKKINAEKDLLSFGLAKFKSLQTAVKNNDKKNVLKILKKSRGGLKNFEINLKIRHGSLLKLDPLSKIRNFVSSPIPTNLPIDNFKRIIDKILTLLSQVRSLSTSNPGTKEWDELYSLIGIIIINLGIAIDEEEKILTYLQTDNILL